MGNIQTGVADFFRRDIAAIVFDKEYRSRAKSITPLSTYPSLVNEALGSYSFGPNFKVYVEKVNGILKARANEGGYSELVPMTDGRFFNRTLYSYIEFTRGESGNIEKMIWTNNEGSSFEGLRE